MKTIKRIFLFALCALFFANVHTVNAQVTIGSELEPRSGALLDLKEKADGSSTKGFNLPQVALTSLTSLEPCVKNATDTDKANHKGLQVYNIGTKFDEGVYTWNAAKWIKGGGNLNMKSMFVTRLLTTNVTYTSATNVEFATFEITEAGLYAIQTVTQGSSTAPLDVNFHLYESGISINRNVALHVFTPTALRYVNTTLIYLAAGSYTVNFHANATSSNSCNMDWPKNYINIYKLYIE